MLYNATQKVIKLSGDREIMIETGKLAKQADGSVVVKQGNTMLLATVVAAKDAKPETDFMPLSVEYKEKYAANGRFPGGFLKREARPSDYEILVSRLIDRALRPLFPADYHAEVFVTVTLISADRDIMPDALAGLAASAALAVSDIPFGGPISEVRVARINGQLVINPTFTQNANADLDIMVGATYDNILMVEGEMKEVSEAEMLEAINTAIRKARADGTYDKLLAAFMPIDGKIVIPDIPAPDGERTIRLGTNAAFPPFEYVEGNEIVGFDISMGRYIAADSGAKLEVMDMAFDSLIPALVSDSIDFIAAGMTATDERRKNVDFSDTYYESEQVIIIRK